MATINKNYNKLQKTKLKSYFIFLFLLSIVSLAVFLFVNKANAVILAPPPSCDNIPYSFSNGDTFQFINSQPEYKNGFLNYSIILNSNMPDNFFSSSWSSFVRANDCGYIGSFLENDSIPIPEGQTKISNKV